MDDSSFARPGDDPDRIDEPAPHPGHEPGAQAPEPDGSGEGDPADEWDEFDDTEDGEPDAAAGLNDWLRDNWERLHALARADQLPDLEPPRPGPESEENSDHGPFAFDPVPIRARLDGWTAERQVMFIEALAESACVVEACRTVRMSKQSAYMLRARPEAVSFRNAWDAALDFATRCLADAALSRAVNGVVTPVFYQGEQIGERRKYDERLTMFLLQRRDPARFGHWRDKVEWSGHPEAESYDLLKAKAAVREDAAIDSDDIAGRFAARIRAIAADEKKRNGLQHQRYG